MKKWQWILLAVIAYLLFLVAYMPAVYVSDYAQKQTKNKLSFNNVSGTLFSGQADTLIYDGMQVNNVTWSLSPLSLLLLQGNLDFKGGAIRSPDNIFVDANVRLALYNTQKISVNDAQMFVPIKPLFAQIDMPPGVAVSANGRIRMDIDTFTFNQGCESLRGTGNWLNASVTVSNQPVELGAFDAVLSCEDTSFALQVAPTNGISLDAKIVVGIDGQYSANGEFTIPDDFPNDIKLGAELFGSPKGQGVYELAL